MKTIKTNKTNKMQKACKYKKGDIIVLIKRFPEENPYFWNEEIIDFINKKAIIVTIDYVEYTKDNIIQDFYRIYVKTYDSNKKVEKIWSFPEDCVIPFEKKVIRIKLNLRVK